jgi:hypothetical protein
MLSNGVLKKLDVTISVLFRFLKFFSFGKDSDKCLVIRPGGMGDLVLFDLAIRNADLDVDSFIFAIQKRAEPWAKFRDLNYVLLDANFFKFMFFSKHRFVICSEQFFASAADFSRFFLRKDSSLIGFDSNKRANIFTRQIDYDENLHESKNFQKLLNELPRLSIKSSVPKMNVSIIRNSDYCVLAIGGTDSESRNLDVERWLFLVKALNKENLPIYLTHSPQDWRIAEQLSRAMTISRIANSFQESIEFIQGSAYLISVDSGMVHVASFFNVPARVLFTSANVVKWRPIASSSWVLSHDFECQPCGKFGQVPKCLYSFRCTKNLDLAKVHSDFLNN